MSAPAHQPYAIMAEFDTPADLLQAATRVRDAGLRRWDVFTPFPVRGMDQVMGLRNSKVGWLAFLGGVAGCLGGAFMVWYMNALDYPLVVGGKPLFSPFAAVPTAYELTLLFAAFGAGFGMLCLNRLPRWHHPLLKHPRFTRVTRDGFFLVIETSDPNYSEPQIRQLLTAAGGKNIELVVA